MVRWSLASYNSILVGQAIDSVLTLVVSITRHASTLNNVLESFRDLARQSTIGSYGVFADGRPIHSPVNPLNRLRGYLSSYTARP